MNNIHIDLNKIMTAIIIAVLMWFGSEVNNLSKSITEITKIIAVSEKHRVLTEKEWSRRGVIVDDLRKIVAQINERVLKLEFEK